MAQTIDFNGLLKDLFQGDMPVKESVQERPKSKRGGADFTRALDEIFQSDTPCENSEYCAVMKESNISPLQACNLYVFMKKIIMEHFGMGYDYAIEIDGQPVKSWFTITETIETAKSLGYFLTVAEARKYLDTLIAHRYIETDNYKYRRCAFWSKEMEKYLLSQ